MTSSGYLQLSDSKAEDLLFYAFYEAQEPDSMDGRDVPIILWLEVVARRCHYCLAASHATCCMLRVCMC